MDSFIQLILENGSTCYVNPKYITLIEPISSSPIVEAKTCVSLCCGTKIKVRQTVAAIVNILQDE